MADPSEDTTRALLSRPTISPSELYESGILQIRSRVALYEALKRGDIDAVRIGKLYSIPTAPLRRRLGIEAA